MDKEGESSEYVNALAQTLGHATWPRTGTRSAPEEWLVIDGTWGFWAHEALACCHQWEAKRYSTESMIIHLRFWYPVRPRWR